jgi:hypothetical protein
MGPPARDDGRQARANTIASDSAAMSDAAQPQSVNGPYAASTEGSMKMPELIMPQGPRPGATQLHRPIVFLSIPGNPLQSAPA